MTGNVLGWKICGVDVKDGSFSCVFGWYGLKFCSQRSLSELGCGSFLVLFFSFSAIPLNPRYPYTPRKMRDALIWNERLEHGYYGRTLIRELVLFPALERLPDPVQSTFIGYAATL
jgi:hypothetical protein